MDNTTYIILLYLYTDKLSVFYEIVYKNNNIFLEIF